MTPLAIILLTVIILIRLLDFICDLLTLKRLRLPPTGELKDVYPPSRYRKMQLHTRATTQLAMVESAVGLVAFVVFWLCGGFGWLADLCQGTGWPPVPLGLLFAGLLYLGNYFISLPFSIYSTFHIEQRFGFNRTSPGLFVADEIRSLLLTAILGGGLLAAMIALYAYGGELGWLAAWLVVASVSLLMMYIGPTLIMPLFNKFTRLPDGELRSQINAFAQQQNFPLEELFEMDGSKRSTRANAFFTGFGKRKRIVLFDTLIKQHPVSELVAILAHEIGHFKLKHIFKRLAGSMLMLGLALWLVSYLLEWQPMFDAFYVGEASVATGLVLAGIVLQPLSWLAGIAGAWQSRKHEFEADHFAATSTGQPGELQSALVKLSRENLSLLNPHPLSVWLHYSHPPVGARLAALEQASGK